MTLDRTHILLGLGAALLALFGVYSIEARIADKAQSRAELASQHAADLEKQNAAFQAATSAEIAELKATISAREASEAKQTTQNRVLTVPQVATEIGKVAQTTAPATQGDTLILPLPLAQTALTDMQLVPLLQADKSDLAKSLELEKQAHTSDVTACRVAVEAAQSETKAVKAKARKNIIKAFFIGVVVGFAGRAAL